MFKRNQKPADILSLGGIPKEFITDQQIEAIQIIANEHPETIFCGSLGLVMNGKLKRPIGDIDILTSENHYDKNDFLPEYRFSNVAASQEFMLGEDKVSSFKLKIGDAFIDVLYNNSGTPPKYTTKGFWGSRIKVEDPAGAIKAKLNYIFELDDAGFKKHLIDLIDMEIPKEDLIKVIKKWQIEIT